MKFNYDVEVNMKSPFALNGGTVPGVGHYDINTGWMADSPCLESINEGLKGMGTDLTSKLKAP